MSSTGVPDIPSLEEPTVELLRRGVTDSIRHADGKLIAARSNLAYATLRLEPHERPSVIVDELSPGLIPPTELGSGGELFAHAVSYGGRKNNPDMVGLVRDEVQKSAPFMERGA
jgi:hypothetical protein